MFSYTHINSKTEKAEEETADSLKEVNIIALSITFNTPYSWEVLMGF